MSNEPFLFNPNHVTWVEKYRPLRVEDCILPDRIKSIFVSYLQNKEFPTTLIHGGPGSGKTTIAKALCDELGIDVLLINVSKDRGIDVLRNDISSFASAMSLDGGRRAIILDEFDGATEALQRALRASIEEFAINCQFFLTCNHPNMIIDAIHSRCAVIDMRVKDEEKVDLAKQFLKRLEQIMKVEGKDYERKAIATLINKHFPDFRGTINHLQSLAMSGSVTVDAVEGSDHSVNSAKLFAALKDKNFSAMRQWVANNAGTDPAMIIREVYDNLNDRIVPHKIPEIVFMLGDWLDKCARSPDAEITLTACFVEFMSIAEFK
jgi:replication factor C small subunit